MDSVSCNLHIGLPTWKEMREKNEVSDCRGVGSSQATLGRGWFAKEMPCRLQTQNYRAAAEAEEAV